MVSLRCLFVIHVLNGVLHSYKLLSKMLIPFPFLASLGKSRPTGYCCILFCYIVLHESCLIRLQLVLNFFLSPLTCFFLFYLLKMSSSTPFPFVIGSLTDFSFVHSFNKYLLSHLPEPNSVRGTGIRALNKRCLKAKRVIRCYYTRLSLSRDF